MHNKRKKKCVRERAADVTDDDSDDTEDDESCHNIRNSATNIFNKPPTIPLPMVSQFSFLRHQSSSKISTSSPPPFFINNNPYLSYSRMIRPFTMPVSTSSLSSSSPSRPSSFGSDPRDSNHPLSITQLVSSHKKTGD